MYQLKRRKLSPGEGIIKLGGYGATPTFHDLEFSYPLKLIAPSRHFTDQLACLYMISYGGGLVANDVVKLDVEVTDGSSLVLLTQGMYHPYPTLNPCLLSPADPDRNPNLQVRRKSFKLGKEYILQRPLLPSVCQHQHFSILPPVFTPFVLYTFSPPR